MKERPLIWSYLAVAAALAVLLSILVGDSGWWDELVPNLVAELVGILVVVGLVDAVLRRRERADRRRREKQALRQLKIPLVHHFHLLINMFKASAAEVPNPQDRDSQVFGSQFMEALQWLDFSADAPVIPKVDWFTHLERGFRAFRDALRGTIDSYGIFIEPDLIDVMEGLINSTVLSVVIQAPAIKQVDQQERFVRPYNLFGHDSFRPYLTEYTTWFQVLLDCFNAAVNEDDRIVYPDSQWRDDVAPAVGSARIDMADVARRIAENKQRS